MSVGLTKLFGFYRIWVGLRKGFLVTKKESIMLSLLETYILVGQFFRYQSDIDFGLRGWCLGSSSPNQYICDIDFQF